MLPPAAPVVTITEDGGGYLDHFTPRVLQYRRAGTLVRIEGFCASACTLVASLPRDRVCVGPEAELAFHQAYTWHDERPFDASDRNEGGTRLLWRMYPPRLRRWITDHGGLGPTLISLKGAALRRLFRTCG